MTWDEDTKLEFLRRNRHNPMWVLCQLRENGVEITKTDYDFLFCEFFEQGLRVGDNG